jgi:elongation factor Ts
MEITNLMIKTLREKTGAGMMDCKRALEATNGDMDAAIDFLRKKGAAVGQKRADRAAKEGMILTRVSADGRTGVILEVNSETDFVGRSDDFTGFVAQVADVIAGHRPANLDVVMGLKAASGKTIAELHNDLLAKVGEKVEVRRFQILEAPDGAVSAYTHLGNKIGVLVHCTGLAAETAARGAGRDIAMQVAAMNPSVVTRDQIAKEQVDHELEIYRTQAKNDGKPDQVIDRIAQGRLEKFFQEVCLMEQTFIKDPAKTVKTYLAEANKQANVVRFVRYHLGEETK